MRPNPSLIPRLNLEFSLNDLRESNNAGDSARQRLTDEVERRWPEMHALFVDSGRTALFLALQSLGLSEGAKVGVQPFTCDAVFEAIIRARCEPVFLDIDPATYTLEPSAVEREIDRLDAMVPIHTFGHPADIDSLRALNPSVKIIEDCAHAIGARYKGSPVGGLGDASFFSFRPGKPLSAGSLGMLLCRDFDVFERAADMIEKLPQSTKAMHAADTLKEFARSAMYHRPWFGAVSLPMGMSVDSRLDLMEKKGFAPHRPSEGYLAVLASRLAGLEERIERRRKIARTFRDDLGISLIHAPVEAAWALHTYFQFVMRFPSSSSTTAAISFLADRGIDSIRFYQHSVSLASRYGYDGDCPISNQVAGTVLSIPCYESLSDADVERIGAALRSLGRSA